MADQKYKVLSTSVLGALTEVRFYEETYVHINDEHPEVQIELPSMQAGVAGAIGNPTHVEQTRPRTYVFVDSKTTNMEGDPLRVAVKHVAGTSDRVSTVYFAETQHAENIIWPKGTTGSEGAR